MAVTKVDICNRSLTLVGASPIVSLTDDTPNAKAINRVYEQCLNSVLAECKWNFATKRANLSVSADTLDFYEPGLNQIYIKPTDLVRVFGVNPATANWKEEGDYIVSDSSGLGFIYVFFLDVPSKYPPYFVDALVDKLASEIAYRIVNSRSLGDEKREAYREISLPSATAANSQTGDQQYVQDDAWELAKYQDIQVNA